MQTKLFTLRQIFKNQGLNYVLFRSQYELKRKLGLLKNRFPSSPKKQSWIAYNEYKKLKLPFLFEDRDSLSITKKPTEQLKSNFEKIKSGYTRYFNDTWSKVDNWLENPDTKHIYDPTKHWTEIEDLSKEAGDIKYVWERSRFSFLYDIIRFDYHHADDNSKFVLSEIESWIDSNPINQGPNYKCSQEISLRLINWIFAIRFYGNSEHLKEEQWSKILNSIYWQVKHVRSNISFSRICVRNNHAITECMMIYFAGLFFPFLKESSEWLKDGKAWVENEIQYQVYSDGTFLQFSHNYQRVLVQLLTWFISISEKYHEKLEPETIKKANSVVDYLSTNCVGRNGQLPNYGSNDGALFFNLSEKDYTDFRPQINALHFVLNKKHLFGELEIQEEALWYNRVTAVTDNTPKENQGLKEFKVGGIYTINEQDNFTFLKCASYKDRPAHADNMHLDIWVKGENFLRDSGTYKYNCSENDINYFAGTKGHNSVMIDSYNQMKKGPRFIWYNWTKDVSVNSIDEELFYGYECQARMFDEIASAVTHQRQLKKEKGKLVWYVRDEINGKESSQKLKQFWHPNPSLIEKISIQAYDENGQVLEKKTDSGYWSEYYGKKKEVPIWYFETSENIIKTKIEISL